MGLEKKRPPAAGGDHPLRTPWTGQGAGLPRVLAGLFLAGALAAGPSGCAPRQTVDPAAMAAPRISPEALLAPSGGPVAAEVFASGLARADYILLGEEHPNPCDHLAQAGVLRRLVAAGVRPAVGFEMVPADLQDVLDAFNAGKLTVADLPRALAWKTTWGYDFALYAPIFETAREYGLPVFALNAPSGLARKVGRMGLDGLTPAERAALPGAVLPPAPAQVEELRELFQQHAAMLEKTVKAPAGRDRLADFLTVQALWDTQMAERALLARAMTGRPVVVIAGGGHVERGFGIARRLAVFDPKARVETVMPWRGGENPDPAQAGTFYACPAVHKSRLGMTLSHEAPAPGQPAQALLVTAVAPGSPAAAAGLLAGDAVTAAGSHKAAGLGVLHTAAVEAAQAGTPLTLTVFRAGETITVAIPLAAPAAPKK
uniref:Uncharacterized iron-regulated protein n=1 Tax=Desulfovibrio sp. U5L TaxID=596152 RepID=I2PZS2_9BACT